MTTIRIFWWAIGALALALGLIGAVLPLLPTTPFLILAAFAFSKSSPRVERWLIEHPRFGPTIMNWRRERAIARKAKWLATIVMLVTLAGGLVFGLSSTVLTIQALVFAGVCTFLWTRPEPRADLFEENGA
ncbi:DUF454 domain-containing protein [Fulvimarina endophytica]|uniref:DUF454 domain-containing protein n=1 Tax=Fulvimarina endophytica TaxID=2293836 RepID=A0A371XAI1_9HYPH|nr:YbaN family protein [Fulvimarina endophytica]RFC66220.1 DUF454 domain-containing protein [Fulvimarina endophytica]